MKTFGGNEVNINAKAMKRDEESIKRFFSLYLQITRKVGSFTKALDIKLTNDDDYHSMWVTLDQRILVKSAVTKVSDSIQNETVGNLPW